MEGSFFDLCSAKLFLPKLKPKPASGKQTTMAHHAMHDPRTVGTPTGTGVFEGATTMRVLDNYSTMQRNGKRKTVKHHYSFVR
jgi:hypothetical protein